MVIRTVVNDETMHLNLGAGFSSMKYPA